MVDSVQLVLLVVIIALTVLLVVLGVQVFHILKELRQTIVKTNKVIDNANAITEDIEGPLSAVTSLLVGFKGSSFLTVARIVKSLLGRERDDDRRHRRDDY